MIKASDIGLSKEELSALEDAGKVHKQFMDYVLEQADRKALERLNEQTQHTIPQLVGIMRYKAQNIKAHISPHIFVEIAEMLEQYQEKLQDKIYTEEDL